MRTAIFGGTFDPVHLAHIRIAVEAADLFALDHVLVVPSSQPPHKPKGVATPYEDRFRMVELACAADPRLAPSRLEEGQGKSYSIDTIRRVRADLGPGDRLFFIIGADAFAEVTSWRQSAEVLKLVEFIVASRPGYRYPVPEGASIHRLETLALTDSSSAIRRKLEEGGPMEELAPRVLAYIRARGLYQPAA